MNSPIPLIVWMLLLFRALAASFAAGEPPPRPLASSTSLGQVLTALPAGARAELDRIHADWRVARDRISSKSGLRRIVEGFLPAAGFGSVVAAGIAGVSTGLQYLAGSTRPFPRGGVVAALAVGASVGAMMAYNYWMDGGRTAMDVALQAYVRDSSRVLERASPPGMEPSHESLTQLHFESEARNARTALESGGPDAEDLQRTDRTRP